MMLHFSFALTQIRRCGEAFKLYIWKNRLNRVFFYFSAVLVALSFLLVFIPGWRLQAVGDTVAIRYNIYFGVDLVGNWSKLLFYPVVALGLVGINTLVAGLVYKKEKLMSYFVAASTAIMLIVNLVTLIFVLTLNFEFIEK